MFEKLIGFFGKGGKEDKNIYEEEKIRLRVVSELYNLLSSGKGQFLLYPLFAAIQDKQKLVEMVETYKDTFFHEMISNMLMDDVLSVDPGRNNIVEISSDNESVNEVLEELQERIDIDSFVQNVTGEIIAYGDYAVKVVHDGKKVIELSDSVNQKEILTVYKGIMPVFYLKRGRETGSFEVIESIDYIHFCVPGRKIRFKTEFDVREIIGEGKKIDEYIRIGKPLFWGVWDVLNSLYMLLVFYPVFAVQKLNASTILGVRIPKEMPPAKAYEVVKKYQELLNVSIAVDELGRVSVADVIDTIGKYKVIPVWEEEKGIIQLNDPRFDEAYNLDVVEELKRIICATVGVPYQILFGSTEGMGKLDVLKAFNRYVKKVARYQQAIKNGLVQLALIECKLKGFEGVKPSMIDVRFMNNIVSVEHLDKLEFLGGMIDTVNSAVDVVAGLAEKIGGEVNREKLIEFVNDYFGLVGLSGIIKIKEEGEIKANGKVGMEGEFEGEEGVFSGEEEIERGIEEVPFELEGEEEEIGREKEEEPFELEGEEEEEEKGVKLPVESLIRRRRK